LQNAYDDLRQSRQTLTQQERLRALGQMASGIAHDINNALSPMALYTSSLLEREEHLSPQGREQLSTISCAIDDVADTVARLREFYRPREAQLRLTRVDLNGLVRQVLELTRVRWRDQPQERGIVIEVRAELAESVPTIQGAEAEIRDALTNLIFNAIDAMPEGGVLTVSTSALRERMTPSSPGERAGQLCVAVTDTGAGMDEETQRHCLEPFFTTKGERGTGLGLAMVYGMAQRHGAELEIQSALGAGTTLRLIFPVATAEPSPAASVAVPARPLQRLRILVIDDDPLLTQSLRDTLEGDGHSVRTADGGQAGIDEFLAAQKGHEPFAVVITDLGMPYVDGRKVATTLRAAAPRTPIIMLTGWGQRLLSENDTPPDVDRVLAKPPKLRELRAALAELTAQIEDVPAHA
jgi:nitrogen-specific signal transduction histidine kinase/ActR/RegA family two-component response regulator